MLLVQGGKFAKTMAFYGLLALLGLARYCGKHAAVSFFVQWIDSKSGKDTIGIQFGYCLDWMKDDTFALQDD